MTCSATLRSSSRLSALCGLAFLALACGSGGTAAPGRSFADLTNPYLGVEQSSWLVGPVSRLATPEEIDQYLQIRDDAQAEAFIQQFWDRHDATPDRPGNPLREAFEERSAQADRLYSEAGYLGRRTDRGTIYVLYGAPKTVDFEVAPIPDDPPIEVWVYGSDSPAGLDGRRPVGQYRFTRRGDLTVIYVPRNLDDPRMRRQPPGYGS
ncbi:MAG TPA: GWxTD domain-containing protein [Thermoanaerobaculia bacterium]|nr:GWxTD domain-containing protein [Thermoanaerobaculia bacterium]